MAEESHKRSQALQIYLKEAIAEEKVLLEIWESMRLQSSRKQNLFRDMLVAGLQSLMEQDRVPEDVIEDCDLDRLMERRLKRKHRVRAASRGDAPQMPVGPSYQYPCPPPGYPIAHPAPIPAPAYGYPVQPHPEQQFVPAQHHLQPGPQIAAAPAAPVEETSADVSREAPVQSPRSAPTTTNKAAAATKPQTTDEATKKKPRFDLM
jgi:hypothetical protein